jgi:hypothetical protein
MLLKDIEFVKILKLENINSKYKGSGGECTVAGSVGLQLGVQSKSIILLFMTKDVLAKFRNSEGRRVMVWICFFHHPLPITCFFI